MTTTDIGQSDLPPPLAFWSDEVNMESLFLLYVFGGGSDRSININYQN